MSGTKENNTVLSRMAMDDCDALRADGINVPPREVVRLNALGLRAELGPATWRDYAAPRVAFLGDCVLHEPTLGAEMWLKQACDVFDADDEQTWVALRILSCLRPWRELPNPTDRKAVLKAVYSALEPLSAYTVRQIQNALEWCVGGNLPESGERPPPREREKRGEDADADSPPERFSPEYGLFLRGTALRIGTAADMKDMTYSMMVAACDRAEAIAGGGNDRKAEKATAMGDYFRALDAVRGAGKGEDCG